MKSVRKLRWIDWLWIVLALLPPLILWQFLRAYAYEVPYFDDALQSLDIAFRAANGNFRWSDVLTPVNGHLVWLAYGTVGILGSIIPWQPMHTLYLIFALALIRWALLVRLMIDLPSAIVWIAAFASSIVVFSISQNLSWLSSVMISWSYTVTCLVAIVTVLTIGRGGVLPLIVAGVLALVGTFSIGIGLAAFPVVLLTLWMFGYRWRGYLFWIALTIIGFGLVLPNTAVNDDGSTLLSLLTRLHWMAVYLVAFTGGMFFNVLNNNFIWQLQIPPGQDQEIAVFAGVFILLSTVGNLIFLWRRGIPLVKLAPWITLLGMGMASGALIYAGRSGQGETLFPLPLQDYYVAQSIPSVVAWIVLSLWVIGLLVKESNPSPTQHLVLRGNTLIGILLLLLFIRGQNFFLQNTARLYERDIYTTLPHIAERCVYEMVFTQDGDCLGFNMPYEPPDDIYRMAYYGMSVFRDDQPRTILPEIFSDADRLLIETNTPWMNAYLRTWHLNNADESQIFHITAQEEEFSEVPTLVTIDELREPLTNWHTDINANTAEALTAFLADTQTVYYISNQEILVGADMLTTMGYIQTDFSVNEQPYRDTLTIRRYVRQPAITEQQTYTEIADTYRLWAFSLSSGNTITPCEVVTLTSWWDAVGEPDDNYALRWVLLDKADNVVSFSMSGLSNTPTLVWEPDSDNLYLDERQMALPCELTPGEYHFALSIETGDQSVRLPITGGTLSSNADRAILQTVMVGTP
jgi:hypothetical protein